MVKQQFAESTTDHPIRTPRAETPGLRQLLGLIARELSAREAFTVTTLPRVSLQIAQPIGVSEGLFKPYSTELYLEDRLTWSSVLRRRPIAASEAFKDGSFESSRYLKELLAPNGLRYGAAAPLNSPVLEGFAGAVHVYRTAEQGPFTPADLERLRGFAEQIDELTEQTRSTRREKGGCPMTTLSPRPPARQFVFDGKLREISADPSFEMLDSRIREQLLDHATSRLSSITADVVSDRLQVPSSRGDLWTFRIVVYSSYAALGNGPFVIFSLYPDCCEWGVIRAADFQADPELSRLIPALRFMHSEYRRSPTLNEISKTVHLSPFHFHRRFAELLGLTPKHFLLECQIYEAKIQLLAGKKELAQIATDCGFAHQSHFTSRFKQATGLTPTRWRRSALTAQRQQED
jgi:AraC-like DNA-binding protein